jgi:hypothetical protein
LKGRREEETKYFETEEGKAFLESIKKDVKLNYDRLRLLPPESLQYPSWTVLSNSVLLLLPRYKLLTLD